MPETIVKVITLEIIISGVVNGPKNVRGLKNYQGEGGGGSGRMGLDCGLRPGLAGGVEGNGRLNRANCFAGTSGRFRFRWKD